MIIGGSDDNVIPKRLSCMAAVHLDGIIQAVDSHINLSQ